MSLSLSIDANSNESADYTAVLGKGMLRNNRLLPVLLGQSIKRWYPWHRLTKRQAAMLPQYVAGWGNKKSYRRASHVARKIQRPVLSIEDGFLRSIDSGINSRYGCSVIVDKIGIYFDLNQTSSLEHYIIKHLIDWSAAHEQRAQTVINQIIDYKLSKYNQVIDAPNLKDLKGLPDLKSKTLAADMTAIEHILLVDQVVGDGSIKGAGASRHYFERMLKTACRNHPQAKIWIKAHPASQLGYLNQPRVLAKLSRKDRQRVQVLDGPANVIALLKQVDVVYTVSSHMGFEALMLGKLVYCFGVSWYAGWGLTNDSYAPKKLLKRVQQRRLKLAKISGHKAGHKESDVANNEPVSATDLSTVDVNVARLFYAAYIDYSRYADPASNQLCEIEQVIEWLNTNRYWFLKLPKQITVYEFSRWKQDFVAHFLQILNCHPNVSIKVKTKPRYGFLQQSQRLGADLTHDILVWGLAGRFKVQNRLTKATEAIHTDVITSLPKLWCMEDGFIRSNGLGSTLLAPLSVVIDGLGIYYDATRPSDLEQMLLKCPPLTQAQVQRVRVLQQRLLTQRVSKYHVGQAKTLNIPTDVYDKQQAKSTTIILIVGQVEDDLSVQYCGSLIKTNTALIERVRQDNPFAYLIFKPHPDVEAGLRVGAVKGAALQLVDDVAQDIAIADCLIVVDEVHTISSLTGFEALLRDKKVCCYGMPFYAGWGLTQDMQPRSTVTQSDSLVNHSIAQSRAERRCQYASQQRLSYDPHPQVDTALTLEQLIYCTLIEYPMYRLPKGYGLAQVEQVIDCLYRPSNHAKSAISEYSANKNTDANDSHAKRQNIENVYSRCYIKCSQVKQLLKTRFMQLRHQILKVIN